MLLGPSPVRSRGKEEDEGLVNHNRPTPPVFFVSVASKELRVNVSALESTLTDIPISVDSKGS